MRIKALKFALHLPFVFGCMTTTTYRPTRIVSRDEVTLESDQGLPSIMGDFEVERGIVHGHLTWTCDCRRATVGRQVSDVVETRKPDTRAAAAAIAAGAVVGVIAGTMLSEADTFSRDTTCSTDINGDYTCSSPHDEVIAWSGLGLVTSAVLLGTGVTTLAKKTTSHVTEQNPAQPVMLAIKEDHVVCGESAVRDVGLSLMRASERVAASTTNADGNVAFSVPQNITGNLTIVVDSVPQWMTNVHAGTVVGSVQLDPRPSDKREPGPAHEVAPSDAAAPASAPTPAGKRAPG